MSELKLAFERCDRQQVIDCLFVIGRDRGVGLSEGDEEIVLKLAVDDDPEVRWTVASCIGLRVGLPSLYPIFFTRLKECEVDDDVRMALIDALGYLARGRDETVETSILFARIAIDEDDNDEVRGAAYVALLHLLGKITPVELAVMPEYLSEIKWDREFVQSVLS